MVSAVCTMKAFSFPCDVVINLVLRVVVEYWLYKEVPGNLGCMEDWFGACVLGNKADAKTVVLYCADKEAASITDGMARAFFTMELFSICLVVRKKSDVAKSSVGAYVLCDIDNVLGSIFGSAAVDSFPLKYITFCLFSNISLETPYKSQTKLWTTS